MCAPCELLTSFLPYKYCSDLVCLITTGTPYTQQSYKVSESFPYKWINKKWKEGFHVTSMATAGNRWGVIMSRNAGYSTQVTYLLVSISFSLEYKLYLPFLSSFFLQYIIWNGDRVFHELCGFSCVR